MSTTKSRAVKKIGTAIAVIALMITAIAILHVQTAAKVYDVDAEYGTNCSYHLNVYDFIRLKNDSGVYVYSGDKDAVAISSEVLNDYDYNSYRLVRAIKPGVVMLAVTDSLFDDFYIKITVNPADINDCEVEGLSNKIYSGSEQKQNLTVTYNGEAVSYNAVYSADIVSPGTHYVDIEGTGAFTGSRRLYYKINMPQASIKNIAVAPTAIKVNLNKAAGNISYQIQAKKAGGNYVTYNLNSNTSKLFSGLKAGTKMAFRVRSYAIIDGKTVFGNWSAAKQASAGISIANCKISGIKNIIYNGKNQTQNVKVTYNGKPATFKLTYDNNKSIGLRSVTITGTGKFAGSVTKTYYIIPPTTKITGLLELWDDYDEEFNRIALKYKAVAGGVTGYQIGIKTTSSGWKYYKTTGVKYLFTNIVEDHMYYVCVRAYKQFSNGAVVYGNWSAVERAFPTNQSVHNNNAYDGNSYISGYIFRAFKGQKLLITVGGKTYTVVINKDAKNYKFKVYVGSLKAGQKVNFKLNNKFNQNLINYTEVVYYSNVIKVGYTKSQVRLVPGFEKPYSINQSAYGDTWYYEWDDGSYGWIYFNASGSVVDWSMYD